MYTTADDFTTATIADTTPPTVISFNPADGKTNTSANTDIVLTFSEPIQRGTGNIVLKTAAGTTVETFDAATSNRVKILGFGETLVLDPTNDLARGTDYCVTFAPGTFKDLLGNPYAGTSTYNFTTSVDDFDSTLATTGRVTVGGSASGRIEDASDRDWFAVSLQANHKYQISLEGLTTGQGTLYFPYIYGIYNNYGFLQENTTSLGSQIVVLFTPTATGTYYISAGSDLGSDGTYKLFVTSKDITAPTVTSFNPANGATGVSTTANIELTFNELIQRGTGKIVLSTADSMIVEIFDAATSDRVSFSSYSLTLDPTSDLINNTGYNVSFQVGTIKDLAGNPWGGTFTSYDFTTVAPVDTTPPAVSTFSPTDGATGVSTTDSIVLTFSEPIQRGTGNIVLKTAAGATVETYVAATDTSHLSISGSTLTIDPASILANSTDYYVAFDAGTIKDLAGNPYAGTTSYDFTTVAPVDTTLPTVSSFSPADGAADVSTTANIVLTMNEPVQRGTGNIVLKTAAGTTVETFDAATSSRLSVSGSALTLDPTSDLANGTDYYVAFDAGTIKDLAGNPYAGTTTYDFTTTTADTTAPTVSSFNPADDATGVATTANIVLTFSEPIQRGSGSIILRNAAGALVEWYDAATSSRVSISGSTLTLDPTSSFLTGTHYSMSFAPGVIKDLAGNPYAGTTAYDFTTVVDNTSPTVSSFNPTDGATGVATTADIVLTFNEPIQRGTGNIVIKTAAGSTVETFNAATNSYVYISGSTLTLDTTSTLAGGTTYYVTFEPGTIKDLAGNPYAGTTTYDFTTLSSGDTSSPVVSTFSPADGATGAATTANIVLTLNEPIQRGTGNIVIKTAAGTTVEALNAATSSHLSISGSTLTIDPACTLAAGTKYFVTFAPGTIKDLAGNPYAGTSSYDFMTAADTSGQGGTLPGFDKAFYLNEKLAALQETSTGWQDMDTAFLENLLASFGFTPESHYKTYGYKEGFAPNAFFNAAEYELAKATTLYTAGYFDSIAAALTAFDAVWTNDPYLHYLQYGSKEGLNPSNKFDDSSYYDAKLAALLADPVTAGGWTGKTALDLKALFDSFGITPLQHYMMFGANEGIPATPVPADEQVHVNLIGVQTAQDLDQHGA